MRKVILLLNFFITLLFAINAKSESITTAQTGNWHVPNTWVGNQVPLATDDVILNHAVTVVSGQRESVYSITNNSILNLNGAITVSGAYLGTGTINTSTSTGELIIKGTGALDAPLKFTGTQNLTNLTINRITTGTVTLGSNLSVSGTLTLTSGLIITGTNILTLGTSTSTLGTLIMPAIELNTSYIAGNFERWIPAAAGTYNFPVGTTSVYRPAVIEYTIAPSSGGSLLVTGTDENPLTQNTDFLLDGAYTVNTFCITAKWQFTPTLLAGGTYNLTLGANNLMNTNQAKYSEIRILKRFDTNSPWYLAGSHSAATNYYTFPIAKRLGVSDGFSQFGLGGNLADGNFIDGPLPVTIKSFTSTISGRNVKLNWVTEKEVNNNGFDVERVKSSESGVKSYEKIGFVESKGNVNTSTSYSFDDKNLVSGRYKYRLKQIDYNGNYEYFELNGDVTVGAPKKFDLSQNYPNPFNPVSKINFDIPEDGKVNLRIYDMLGREVATLVNEVRTAGYYTVSFDASKLSSGMYFYRLNAGNYNAVKKMAVIK